MSTLDNLRKEAKRWLKALREQDPSARARLVRAYPAAPATPGLRDVQHAIARELGEESWAALKDAIARRARTHDAGEPPSRGDALDADAQRFMASAFWDHHIHGLQSHRSRQHSAMRFLARTPAIARSTFYTALVCGELDYVRERLADDPELAVRQGGPRGWAPLLYLCYARVPLPALSTNAVAIAGALLAHGADPNAYYMAGASRYTALVGVAGEGEQDAIRDQPYKAALYARLLEAGAGPYDIQVLYNTHFSGDMLWWLKLTYAHDEARGDLQAWRDPRWSMLDMGGYGPGAYFVLRSAGENNRLDLAEWALQHGADPNLMTSSHPKFKPKLSLYQSARLRGQVELAALLARHGATVSDAGLPPEQQLLDAAMRLDRAAVDALLARHPDWRNSPTALFAAAQLDRADAVALLLDAGTPLEVEADDGQRALHVAAAYDALSVGRLLLARGAEVEHRDRNWGSTPLGFASYGDKQRMIQLLVPVSRNVWTLTWLGEVDRLRQVLAEQPERAKERSRDGATPLMGLPDDDRQAEQVVDLFLWHGADASARTHADGLSAADRARQRGLDGAAAKLEAAASPGETSTAPAAAPAGTFAKFDSLAADLVHAFEAGEPASLQRLMDHFGGSVTWEELRQGVRDRLATVPEPERPEGYFALPHARLVIARLAGFENWRELESLLGPRGEPRASAPTRASEFPPGMIQPVEMKAGFRVRLHDGSASTTTEVWAMLTACRDGELGEVERLVSARPALARCEYDYMTPLHLAVRENRADSVRYLIERGAANANYLTHPYRETLPTVARDRGYESLARALEQAYQRPEANRAEEEGVRIDFEKDDEWRVFQDLVASNALAEVERALARRPSLALDEFSFWGEGVLSVPANRRDRDMLELLMRHGARVPPISKWAPEYYFKHYDIAAFLLERGMDANHMNWHHTSLLHDVARRGDIRKASLLLDHGARIDAVDEEFRSTPLGFGARFGQPDMVTLLLDRGANPNTPTVRWATPLAWARTKGHPAIEEQLRRAGARDERPRRIAPDRARAAATVFEAVDAAVARRDPDALAALMREHRDVFEEHRPYWLGLDPASLILRARPARHLPVRPDIKALEREVEAEGGGATARLAVARAYGAESWERLARACELTDAIWRDDYDAVQRLVEAHPRLLHEGARVTDGNWGPPMTYAANLGRNRIIRMLHEHGARDIEWAMGRAILQGQLDTARMLYELGARPPQDASMLDGPAETLNAAGMAFLLELGVDIGPDNAPVGMVLETYSRHPRGKHQILELFAARGVRLPDTPPMAVHRGRIDLLEAHLQRDPGLFSRTFSHAEIFPPEVGCHTDESLALVGTPLGGSGLLHMCVEYHEIEIARWMIDRGADVNLRARVEADGFGGHTALFNCAVSLYGGRPRSAEFTRLLLDHGADTSVRASLRKGMRFSDDESVHEYRDVTPLEWGARFHDRSLVNEEAVRLIATRTGR